MPSNDAVGAIRSSARSFEEGLPPAQRKRLGQFFTGLPLGSLLAHLALDDGARTVVDPMAGHGDLLDAAATAARSRGGQLEQVDGVEVDSETAIFCARRTAALQADGAARASRIVSGTAFDPRVVAVLDPSGYDLVITNPPYVRYQSQSSGQGIAGVRRGLSAIADARTAGAERALWQLLIQAYSGLADLSVPAWLLAALLTRPGGRLALVVPATWRSRDYADVVRYLLLRAFRLEFVVADTQPGWFSDVLVRTHLVVARRLDWDEAQAPLSDRPHLAAADWLEVAPAAAGAESLVGAAFPGADPEREFANWVRMADRQVHGIGSRPFSLDGEFRTLEQRLAGKAWFRNAEYRPGARTLSSAGDRPATMPEGFRDMVPPGTSSGPLQTLEQAGILVGQGLRSGSNRFFYVTLVNGEDEETVTVEASNSFGNLKVRVPAAALRPVLHRQSDMPSFANGRVPASRALVLSDWVLPEDEAAVAAAAPAYRTRGAALPRAMPPELAAYVRMAASHAPDPEEPLRLIPDLSAVRTNVRHPVKENDIPRFWYMLPPFKARHLPAVFTPRINHGPPDVALNRQPPILIDANFSTLWSNDKQWSPHALYALLRSSWCRAAMESVGTPLGGGALKLEATHIRQVPVPPLSAPDRERLATLGGLLAASVPSTQQQIDLFVLAAVFSGSNEETLYETARYLSARLEAACAARQRSVDDC